MATSPEATATLVAAATPKLPTFYTKSLELWFGRAEAEFRTSHPTITTELTKFDYLVKALDEDTALLVADLIANPPDAKPYSTLKDRLLKVFSLSDRERASRVLDYPPLGDTPAAKMMDDVYRWLGDNPGQILLKEILLRHLPENIRVVLENDSETDLRELAAKADRLRSSTTGIIAAAGPAGNHQKKNQKPPESICRFHRKFGAEARTCQGPCIFSKLTEKTRKPGDSRRNVSRFNFQ